MINSDEKLSVDRAGACQFFQIGWWGGSLWGGNILQSSERREETNHALGKDLSWDYRCTHPPTPNVGRMSVLTLKNSGKVGVARREERKG